MKVAIYGSRRQERMYDQIGRLVGRLQESGCEIVMHFKLYDHLRGDGGLELDGVVRTESATVTADKAVSIGGDGTYLRTVRWAGTSGVPVAGVNTGHLGYLAAYTVDETDEIVDAVVHGRCVIERRTLIELVSPARRFGPSPSYALNEVAILKADSSSMVTMHARVNDRELATYRADGLLIATPTGSTGYNLSVGGPIVAPTARNFVLSPVAAHSLTMRPLVLPDDVTVTVRTECRSENYLLSVDGRCAPMRAGSTVSVRRAPFMVSVVQRADHTFMDTLRDKLSWGV